MKSLVYYIKEELDKATLNKIAAARLKNKKEALVAIKKVFAKKNTEELQQLAEKIYSAIGNYEDPDDAFDALDNGDIDGWEELYDDIVKTNGNNEVDIDTVIDVIERIANGKNLDTSIAELAKKL